VPSWPAGSTTRQVPLDQLTTVLHSSRLRQLQQCTKTWGTLASRWHPDKHSPTLCIFCCLGRRGTNSKSSILHALSHDRSAASPESSLAWIVRLDFVKTTNNFFFCLTLLASFVELRTCYIEHAAVGPCTCPNTDKQQNSKKRLHAVSPLFAVVIIYASKVLLAQAVAAEMLLNASG
jgi:hypothetical protein